jgi:hypothetical protein
MTQRKNLIYLGSVRILCRSLMWLMLILTTLILFAREMEVRIFALTMLRWPSICM